MNNFVNRIFKILLVLLYTSSVLIVINSCSGGNSINDNVLTELGIKNNKVNTNLTEEEISAEKLKAPEVISEELSLTNTKKEEQILLGYHKIVEIAGMEDINFDNISETYSQSGLRDITIRMDNLNRTSYDPEIRDYIRLGKKDIENSELKLINTIAKVFNDIIHHQLSLAVNEDIFYDKTSIGSPNHWDKAYIYFKAMDKWIRNASNYLNDETLNFEKIESHFKAGSVLVYQNTEEAHTSLYIESERIKKKVNKVFFVNMIENLQSIKEEKTSSDIDYERILRLIINSRSAFETFSRTLGNIDIKKLILKEIGKTFSINPNVIINNTIFYIFYYELNNILINLQDVLSSDIDIIKENNPVLIAWDAYFYYTIFNFDFIEKMGEDESDKINYLWASLISAIENGNVYLAIDTADVIKKYLFRYIELLDISYIG